MTWSDGVLECWSNASQFEKTHHSSIPVLHHSNLLVRPVDVVRLA